MSNFWILVWILIFIQMAIGVLVTQVYYDDDSGKTETTGDGVHG